MFKRYMSSCHSPGRQMLASNSRTFRENPGLLHERFVADKLGTGLVFMCLQFSPDDHTSTTAPTLIT